MQPPQGAGIIALPRSTSLRDQLPDAVLDAGEDIGARLNRSLYACVNDLASGQLLCVISKDPKSRDEVPAWCDLTGNRLQEVEVDGEQTVFWVMKG